MESNLTTERGFLKRYDDSSPKQVPLVPFIVATCGRFQDILLVGPESVDANLAEFKTKLFAVESNLSVEGIKAKVFEFKPYLAFGTVLTSSVPDDTGRPGLKIVLGILAQQGWGEQNTSIVVEYFDLFLKTINTRLGLELPLRGVDDLVLALQATENANKTVTELGDVFGSMLLAARILQTACQWVGRTATRTRWLSRKREYPKIILYDDRAGTADLLGIILKERARKFGRFRFRRFSSSLKDPPDIKLLPINTQGLFRDTEIQAARLEKFGEKLYLCLY